ncbi:dihydropyrimidinase [Clostridiales bacterium oral taxon 876 str. F0540]|nr:dihydropyrimidinase [Clostridiales bacterium oral taxon 876 str. F0540]
MSTIIKNGTIITASDTYIADIHIDGDTIKQIGVNLPINNHEVIDATGRYVIPGGIDVHTHLNLDVGIAVAKDDFYTGTVAAACGGTTTIVDHMGFGPKGCNLKHQVDAYHGYADGKAVIDYSFHGVLQHVNEEILDEMEEIINNEGIPSFKAYLTYDYKLSDMEVLKVLIRLKELGGLTTVHPENDAAVNYLRSYYSQKGMLTPIYHALSRPQECEAEAINRMINLAAIAGNAPLYIVHLSCGLGLDYIKMASERGQKVYAETCPQYLLLDDESYNDPNNEGLKYIMSPPLRKKQDQEKLWKGIRDGFIQVVATDHCPFDFNGHKQLGKDDFTKCPNGTPGIETRVPLLFSEGVSKGRISINKFVEIIAANPAKIFGLYPQKGTIAVGADADIVIIDPKKEVVMTNSILHENVDYTAYEGMRLKGYPVLTLVRGKVVAKDNKFVGEAGYGKFIKRSINL